jgi:hypothetical protein
MPKSAACSPIPPSLGLPTRLCAMIDHQLTPFSTGAPEVS